MVDDLVDGLRPATETVLAARPSIGKTALAANIAEHIAFERKQTVLFVSLEMAFEELTERLVISRSRIDGYKLATGAKLNGREQAALDRAVSEIRGNDRLQIVDHGATTIGQIGAIARQLKARQGLALVVVDYLQLLNPSPEDLAQNRQEQVAAMSRRLKEMARNLQVPVIALSQLNRAVENREDRRPRMADLRESGAIEQDADIVLLLHRPEYYDPNDQPGIAELIVAKNRNGRTGTAKLVFRRDCLRFEDWAPDPVGY